MVHRPIALSEVDNAQASISLVTLASSSKHLVQILQLLDERKMSFSFCLNRTSLLASAGFGLLLQLLDMRKESKLQKDSHDMASTVADLLDNQSVPGLTQYRFILESVVSKISETSSRRHKHRPKSTNDSTKKPRQFRSNVRQELKNIAYRYSLAANQIPRQNHTSKEERQAAFAALTPDAKPRENGKRFRPIAPSTQRPHSLDNAGLGSSLNLDYFSFADAAATPSGTDLRDCYDPTSGRDWERLLMNSFDGPQLLPDGAGQGSQLQSCETDDNGKTDLNDLYPNIFNFTEDPLDGSDPAHRQGFGEHSEDSLTSSREDFGVFGDAGIGITDNVFDSLLTSDHKSEEHTVQNGDGPLLNGA